MSLLVPSKAWMKALLLSEEYINGAKSFIKFTQDSLGKDFDWYCCPCIKCHNLQKSTAVDVFEHVICNGIDKSYTSWIHHGESFSSVHGDVRSTSASTNHGNTFPRMEDMVNDAFRRVLPHDLDACLDETDYEDEAPLPNSSKDDSKYKTLMEDALQPLYPSCSNEHTKLSVTIELLSMKSRHKWSNNNFDELLETIKKILPGENTLPLKTSSAKKMINSLRMKCEIIHACKNNCILYWDEYKDNQSCPNCFISRWKPMDGSKPKSKPLPWKKLRYFPLAERLQKLYNVPWIAEKMTWHAKDVQNPLYMRHPVDTSCWNAVNYRYKDFAAETRNVRLGMATDGFNPFGNKSNSYSCWPIMIVPYNLPPSLCMRKEFVMLTLLTPGPSGPGHDIDVYLKQLIVELQELWDEGVATYDSFLKGEFILMAILLWAIHDFPAYGHLSGCRTSGRYACPPCGLEIDAKWLKHGKTFSYMGHRRFLAGNHQFRLQKAQFNWLEEHGRRPRRLSGSEILSRMERLETRFGKVLGQKRKSPSNNEILPWTKRSILYDLPYWKDLPVRHNIDVMHVEKNVAENLFATMMDTKGKTKDGIAARRDLKALKIRKKMWPVNKNGKLSYAKAPYCLSRSEREIICKTLHQLKVPSGYSTNWKHNVNLEDFQLKSLKFYDYHILIQQLLPMLLMHAFKNQKPLRKAIRELSLFFNVICSKVISRAELLNVEKRIVETLCVFEKYFPPSFFVSMIHLLVHLAEEIKACGPPRFRWMYLFERMMKVYKGYVGNQTYPEGCITEQYLMDEAMRYCMEYIPESKRGCGKKGKGIMTNDEVEPAHPIDKKGKCFVLSNLQYQQARKWVIKKSPENAKWERNYDIYLQTYKVKGRKSRGSLPAEKELDYVPWLRQQLEKEKESTFKRLVDGSSFEALSYNAYDVNGYVFHTYESDLNKTTQNNGVSMKAITSFRSSAKDKNPIDKEATYYGIVKQIVELNYYAFKEVVFYCDWVRIEDTTNGCTFDPGTNQVYVNFGRFSRNDKEDDEPFILASQATQVFYCRDLSRENWYVVLDAPKRSNHDMDIYEDPLVFEGREDVVGVSSNLDDSLIYENED